MKYCSNCGNKLDIGDKFCSICGNRVNDNVKKEFDEEFNQYSDGPVSMRKITKLLWFLSDDSRTDDEIIEYLNSHNISEMELKLAYESLHGGDMAKYKGKVDYKYF